MSRYCKLGCGCFFGFILVLEGFYSYLYKGRYIFVDVNDVYIYEGIHTKMVCDGGIYLYLRGVGDIVNGIVHYSDFRRGSPRR